MKPVERYDDPCCALCVAWAARTEQHWARRQAAGVSPYACPSCGSTEWARTTEYVAWETQGPPISAGLRRLLGVGLIVTALIALAIVTSCAMKG